MRYFIIGVLMRNNKHPEAYKIYDADTRQAKLVDRETLIYYMDKGVKIAGYKLNSYVYKLRLIETTIHTANSNFNVSRLDRLDASGFTEQPKTYILIGQHGFGDQREYITVDANATIHQLSADELKLKIKEGNLIGATLDDDTIKVSRVCSKQYY